MFVNIRCRIYSLYTYSDQSCFACFASASKSRSRQSSVATLRSCHRCVWLRALWPVGTSRRRHTCTVDRSACLVEPLCSWWSPFCSFSSLCRPHQAQPMPRVVAAGECPSRGLVEGFVLRAARSELLCCSCRLTATARATPSFGVLISSNPRVSCTLSSWHLLDFKSWSSRARFRAILLRS